MANEIVAELTLELKKVKGQLKKFEGDAKKSGSKAGKKLGAGLEKGIKKSLGGLKRTVLGVGLALAGAFAGRAVLEAAKRQEDAVNQLNIALKATGQFSEETSKSLQEYASSLQKSTKFGDEAIIETQALIQSLGKLTEDGLKEATKASLNLAAGLGIDLRAATLLVGKAAAGEVSSFSRYGLIIKKGADNAETFSNALNELNKSFGGAAAAQVETFSGSTQQLSNSFGDLLEEVGFLITTNPVVIESVKTLNGIFVSMSESISNFVSEGGIKKLNDQLLEMAFNIVTTVGPVLEFVVQLFDVTLQELITDTDKALEKLFDFDATASAERFISRLDELNAMIAEPAKNAGRNVSSAVKEGVDEGLQGITFEQVSIALDKQANKIKITSDGIAKSLNNTFVGAATSAFSSFGSALANGGNAFAEFGKSILKSLGQILIQFGGMLIAVGVGLSTVPFLFGLQGPAAVAAGAAAVIAGSALVALAGAGGGGTAAAGAPTAGTGSTGSTGDSLGDLNEPVEATSGIVEDAEGQGPRTDVTVNIAGNVLDRRQTGIEIVDVINEAFNNEGVTIAQVGATA